MQAVKRKSGDEVATCPFCGELLAILPTEKVNLWCRDKGRVIKPRDVLWIPQAERDNIEIRLGGDPQPVCSYCGGFMRSVGVPLRKHLCNGQYGEGSDIIWIPRSHIPVESCGGADTSSGDLPGSFLGGPFEGPQLGDDQVVPSAD